MRNIFSVEETTPEVHEAFTTQPQAGTQPTAPTTNPHLPQLAPVELQSPVFERAAEVAGERVDWKSTPVE